MKESYWGYWLILLGIFVIVIMLLIQNVTSNNTEDYYTIKQIAEQSMEAAIDKAYYAEYGELKINKEKFAEGVIRRFAEVASLTSTYTINIVGVYEAPPKASIEIISKTGKYIISSNDDEPTQFDITNRIDGILELGNGS